jgi:hypothetical protein
LRAALSPATFLSDNPKQGEGMSDADCILAAIEPLTSRTDNLVDRSATMMARLDRLQTDVTLLRAGAGSRPYWRSKCHVGVAC